MTIGEVEIAKLAGVSQETVARVLHKKGRVSPKTAEHIKAVINSLSHNANSDVQNLKPEKDFTIGLILPMLDADSGYWRHLYTGINKAEKELSLFSIKIKKQEFDKTDPSSYLNAINNILESKIDALIITPLVFAQWSSVLEKIKDIPYVFINSSMPDTNPLAVFAQDPFRGGFLAGKILKMLATHSGLFLSMQMGSITYNAYERARGFKAYFDNYSDVEVIGLPYTGMHTQEDIELFLDDFLAIYPETAGIFVVNDAVYHMGTYLKSRNMKDNIALIGYDLIEQNKKGLLDGSVDCIVSQRPELQGYAAVYELYKTQILHQKPKKTIIPIDIFFKENLIEENI